MIRFIFSILIFFSALLSSQQAQCAVTSPLLNAAQQQVAVEKTRNALFANRLQTLRQHLKQKPAQVDSQLLQQAQLTIEIAKQELDGINLTLATASQADILTQSNVQALQDQLQSGDLSAVSGTQAGKVSTHLQAELTENQTLQTLQDERLKLLQNTQSLAQQTLEAAQDWRAQLQTAYQLNQQLVRQKTLDEMALRLGQQQQEWLKRLDTLNQQLKQNHNANLLNTSNYVQLEIGILEAEERANLSQIQLDLARMHDSLDDIAFVPAQAHSVTALGTAQTQTNNLLESLSGMSNMLTNKIELLQKRQQVVLHGLQSGTYPSDIGQTSLGILDDLLANYKQELSAVTNLTTQATAYQTKVTEKLNEQLSSRQGLPGFDRLGWLILGEKLRQVPTALVQTVHAWGNPLSSAVRTAAVWQWLVLLLVVSGWCVLWHTLRGYCARLTASFARHPDRFVKNRALLIILSLMNRHLTGSVLLLGFIGILMTLAIPLRTFELIIDLSLVILLFRIIISLAQLLLVEGTADRGGEDGRLYHRLRWILRLGGVITFLTVLVHDLPVSFDVQDLFGRLFMLFLLVISLMLLRSWVRLPALLGPYLENKGRYLRKLVRWLTLLVPLSIFSNALVGLVGYVELAWSMAVYQGLFLIVLTVYLVLNGLLGELMSFLADQLIRKVRNGWVWREAVLKPIHWIARIILGLFALGFLFQLYGWGPQSWVAIHLNNILNFGLFSFGGTTIRPVNIIAILFIIAIFVWATKWTREFTYRWLFARVKDHGLRNSLAIFSQYIMVAIGVFIALQISGINLTALTVVASMFAVGVGFGLRDLANNFMSGILLLIERPVRVGDYVTVGTYEGEVRHIGMRSIAIRTDDHHELLVPNANVFSQPFINWTHQDNIVRTVVALKFNRVDDPHRIKEIIISVLKSVPNVLANPPLEIYFKELDDVLLKFQVGYYIDFRKVVSQAEARSQVLYALWDRFKAEGIQPPDVIHEIHIKDEHKTLEKQCTT